MYTHVLDVLLDCDQLPQRLVVLYKAHDSVDFVEVDAFTGPD